MILSFVFLEAEVCGSMVAYNLNALRRTRRTAMLDAAELIWWLSEVGVVQAMYHHSTHVRLFTLLLTACHRRAPCACVHLKSSRLPVWYSIHTLYNLSLKSF